MKSNAPHSESPRLGDFLLTRRIGAGAMGQVWHARHVSAPIEAAVKVIDPRVASSLGARRALTREIVAMARLRHPHIVRILDFGKVNEATAEMFGDSTRAKTPFVVMEFVQGVPLNTRAQATSWSTLKNLLLSILDALAHAHARDIVHRDLKPGNVLFVSQHGVQDIKLIDFGIATLSRDPAGSVARHAGTPGFMAPEQVARGGGLRQGPWTDLYALGCMAWDMVCGAPPFVGPTAEVLEAHLRRELPALNPQVELPDEFEAWIRRLLHKDPEHRFQRAADATYQLMNMSPPGSTGEGLVSGHDGPRASHDGFVQDSTWLGTLQPWATESMEALHRDTPVALDAIAAPGPPMPFDWSPEVTVPPDPVRVAMGSRLVHLRPPPFVGMHHQRDQLWEVLRDVREQETQRLVTIGGSRGCGKSRLLEWLIHRSHELGAAQTFIVSATSERAWIAALLRGLLALDPADETALEEQIAFACATHGITDESLLDDLITWLSDGDALTRAPIRSLAAACQRLLSSRASRRPPLVCIDDADETPEVVELIGPLLRPADGSHGALLIALASRGSLELPARLAEMATSVSPPGLRDAERVELLEAFLPLDGRLQDRLLDNGDDTPGFYVDTLRHMIRVGALRAEEHGYELPEGDPIALPTNYAELWSARIERALDDDPQTFRAVATLAACRVPLSRRDLECAARSLGTCFDFTTIESWIDEGLVAETAHESFYLRGAIADLVRDVLRQRSLWVSHVNQLVDQHDTSGWLAREHGSEILGKLLLEVNRDGEALPHLLAAARQRAMRIEGRATTELTDLVETAARRAERDEGAEVWSWIHWLRSRTLSRAGRYDEALVRAQEALEHARTHGHEELARMAALRVSGALAWLERTDEAEAQLLELLRVMPERGEERARANVELAWIYRNVGRTEEARDRILDALSEDEVDPHLVSIANQRLGSVLKQLGDIAGARQAWARGVEVARAERNPLGMATCLNGLANIARLENDLEDAERLYEEAREHYDRAGSGEAWLVRVNLAQCLVLRGRYEDARDELTHVIGMLRRQGRDTTASIVAGIRVPCSAGLGDWPRFDADLERLHATLLETGVAELDVGLMSRLAGQIALEQEDTSRALRAFEAALLSLDRLSHPLATDVRETVAQLKRTSQTRSPHPVES